MDISNLATQELSEDGKWFRVELYGEKQNLWVKLIGGDSDKVQKFQRKQFKKLNANAGKDKKIDDDTLDELLDDVENAVLRIQSMAYGEDKPDLKEPLELCGQVVSNDDASYRFVLEKIPALKKWIVDKSNERMNFLSDRKKA